MFKCWFLIHCNIILFFKQLTSSLALNHKSIKLFNGVPIYIQYTWWFFVIYVSIQSYWSVNNYVIAWEGKEYPIWRKIGFGKLNLAVHVLIGDLFNHHELKRIINLIFSHCYRHKCNASTAYTKENIWTKIYIFCIL